MTGGRPWPRSPQETGRLRRDALPGAPPGAEEAASLHRAAAGDGGTTMTDTDFCADDFDLLLSSLCDSGLEAAATGSPQRLLRSDAGPAPPLSALYGGPRHPPLRDRGAPAAQPGESRIRRDSHETLSLARLVERGLAPNVGEVVVLALAVSGSGSRRGLDLRWSRRLPCLVVAPPILRRLVFRSRPRSSPGSREALACVSTGTACRPE